jgi:hypothetical protein
MKKETKISNPALPVAYHLEAPVVRGAEFAPFLGGSALKGPENWSLGLLRDDLGEDHVSDRNPHLSELSVLYAAWKNHPEWTHYGIAHYRRFLVPRPTWVQRWLVQPEFRLWTDLEALTPAFTLRPEDLRGQQLLVSTTRTYRVPLRADYLRWHDSCDLAVLQEAMERHHSGMSKPWNRFLDTSHDLTPFNMMFGARAEVDRYCEWLFPMLLDADRELGAKPDGYAARHASFLAERLFSFYLQQERISLRRVPVVQLGSHSADRYPLLHGTYDRLKRR